MANPEWVGNQWTTIRGRSLGLTVPIPEVLDPKLWRERFAFGLAAGVDPNEASAQTPLEAALCAVGQAEGVDVSSLLGTARSLAGSLSDATIRWHLRAALSELEIKLGFPMSVQIVKTPPFDSGDQLGVTFDRVGRPMPYLRGDLFDWYKLDLPEQSIISVERIRGFWFDNQVFNFDNTNPEFDSLITLEWDTQGGAHVLPTQLQGLLVAGTDGGAETYGMWHTMALHSTQLPAFWRFDYTVGPVTKDGKVGQIEAVLAQWVYAVAGRTLLSMSGLAQSKGLTSASVSMDGASRSIGLQASAIYGINSALENVYHEIEKRIDWKQIKRYKRGLKVLPYGY